MARCPFPAPSTPHPLGLRAASSNTQSRSPQRPPERRARGRQGGFGARTRGSGTVRGAEGRGLGEPGRASDAKATSSGKSPQPQRRAPEKPLGWAQKAGGGNLCLWGRRFGSKSPRPEKQRGSPRRGSKRPCYSAGRGRAARCSSPLPLARGRSLPAASSPLPGPGRVWPRGGG